MMSLEMMGVTEPNFFKQLVLDKTKIAPFWQNHQDRYNQDSWVVKQNEEITTLYHIGMTLNITLNLNEVVSTIYRESGRLFDTANFAIGLYDDQTDTLNFALMFSQGKRVKPFSIKEATHHDLIGQVIRHQVPLLLPDLLKNNPAHTRLQTTNYTRPLNPNVLAGAWDDGQLPEEAIRSWLGVPILNPALSKSAVQGVIITWSHLPEAFTDRDTWLLSEIGTQAALAIRNARLLEDSQRRALELAVFDDVARTLTGTLNLDEVLTMIMEQVERMLAVEAGILFLIDPLTDELVFQTALGDKVKTMKPFRLAKGQGVAGRVASIGRPVCLTNVTPQIRNVLCVPLILHGQISGVLEVRNKRDGDFVHHDLSLLTSFAAYAAIGIGNARLYENVLAERDRVLEAEERARHDLARDLHDGPTQIVSGLVMGLEFCQNLLEKEPKLLAQELVTLHEEAERATYQMRTLLFGLRPLILESEGLTAALRVFLERRQKGMKTPKLGLKIEGSWLNSNTISRQDNQVEAAIFAVVQEAVNNAIKHAQAAEITVTLRETYRGLYATIADDGLGFDVEQKMSNRKRRVNLGMVNIQERTELIGGELKITSAPGQGSQLNIYVPKTQEERRKKRTTTGPLNLPSH